jgi:hypothetical protein
MVGLITNMFEVRDEICQEHVKIRDSGYIEEL